MQNNTSISYNQKALEIKIIKQEIKMITNKIDECNRINIGKLIKLKKTLNSLNILLNEKIKYLYDNSKVNTELLSYGIANELTKLDSNNEYFKIRIPLKYEKDENDKEKWVIVIGDANCRKMVSAVAENQGWYQLSDLEYFLHKVNHIILPCGNDSMSYEIHIIDKKTGKIKNELLLNGFNDLIEYYNLILDNNLNGEETSFGINEYKMRIDKLYSNINNNKPKSYIDAQLEELYIYADDPPMHKI